MPNMIGHTTQTVASADLAGKVLREEFSQIYRKPASRYLGLACISGGLAVLA